MVDEIIKYLEEYRGEKITSPKELFTEVQVKLTNTKDVDFIGNTCICREEKNSNFLENTIKQPNFSIGRNEYCYPFLNEANTEEHITEDREKFFVRMSSDYKGEAVASRYLYENRHNLQKWIWIWIKLFSHEILENYYLSDKISDSFHKNWMKEKNLPDFHIAYNCKCTLPIYPPELFKFTEDQGPAGVVACQIVAISPTYPAATYLFAELLYITELITSSDTPFSITTLFQVPDKSLVHQATASLFDPLSETPTAI